MDKTTKTALAENTDSRPAELLDCSLDASTCDLCESQNKSDYAAGIRLSEMTKGDRGVIKAVKADGLIRRRLLDMGLVEGVEFKIIRIAPLGDPIVLKLKGFHLSLRLKEARHIEVKMKGQAGTDQPVRGLALLYSPQPLDQKQQRKTKKYINVALLGNPNSGKTSLFNSLVGTHQKVGNFTGVTVEKYEGKINYKGYIINVVDLPGTYSLTAYSPEEVIARNYIIEEKPDVVVDVVDGTNLERNLYLTTQVMELGADMLVALNMYDEVEKQNIRIDLSQLEKLLGSHVVATSAVQKQGIDALLDHIVSVYEGKITIAKNKLNYSSYMEEKIDALSTLLSADRELCQSYNPRWLATKLWENDQLVYETVKKRAVWPQVEKKLLETISEYDQNYKSDHELVITEDRHSFIRGALQETVVIPKEVKKTVTDRVDDVLINRVLGLPIFLGIMWLIFQMTFKLGEAPMGWIESLFELIALGAVTFIPEGVLQSIVVDGVIAGVGGVLVFLPNIMLLFLAIAFLEGTGYMARAAFVIDKVMHKAGLHGKSFIPMITGFGCSVPAFMACRTLKSKADRITTMMIIPFMSCGAKLPVHILLISAFFAPEVAGNVLFGIYFFGIVVAIFSAKLLKTTVFKGEAEPFVMELPPYRMPTMHSLFFQMNMKAKMYLKKAGTIVLAASMIIWLATNFPQSSEIAASYSRQKSLIDSNETLTAEQKTESLSQMEFEEQAEQLGYSTAGRLGKFIEPVIRPLGFDWRIGVGLTAGLAAKEIVVATLATIFSLGEVDEESQGLADKLRQDPIFSQATALSLMVFVLLYVPCLAATAVFHKEAGAWKWTGLYIGYSMTVAWILAFTVYRIGLYFSLY